MLQKILKRVLASIRWLVGANAILSEQEKLSNSLLYGQRKVLFALGNSLQYASENQKNVRETAAYKRTLEVVGLLSPKDVRDGRYVRVGRSYDGGYVMLDEFSQDIDAAYSFGISDDVSWDKWVAQKEIDVYMYDHTIEGLPETHPRFNYFRVGISGTEEDNAVGLKTLGQLIEENGHVDCSNLIMKIDVEGYEWGVFENCPHEVLNQFSQIAIEFHGLVTAFDPDKHQRVVDVLSRLNQTHQSVHVHANGHEIPLWIGGLVVPPLLEVTYVRRKDYEDRFIENSRQFPTKLDQCSLPGWQDVHLGFFREPNS